MHNSARSALAGLLK